MSFTASCVSSFFRLFSTICHVFLTHQVWLHRLFSRFVSRVLMLFKIQKVVSDVNGVRLEFLTSDTWAIRKFFKYRNKYDKDEICALADFLTDKSVIWDVGANYGIYVLSLLRSLQRGNKVVLCEPLPEVFAVLKGNLIANSAYDICEMYPVNCAVGKRRESAFLYLSSLGSADSRLYKPTDDILLNQGIERKRIKVPVERLDDIALKHFSSYPIDNIIKIDVQGKELAVLEGANTLISSSHRVIVLLELWPHGLRQNNIEPIELVNFFREREFLVKSSSDMPIRGYDELVHHISSYASGIGALNIIFYRLKG